jgi:hypothetical protein
MSSEFPAKIILLALDQEAEYSETGVRAGRKLELIFPKMRDNLYKIPDHQQVRLAKL